VAKSSPNTSRRAIGLDNVKRLVDEATKLGFVEVFLTGGEPFILKDIYEMIEYSSARLPTTVLTNAMIINNSRLEKLLEVTNDHLVLQVSLDGGNAEDHDAFRGRGSWEKAVAGIKVLLENNLNVKLSTTETSANTDRMDAICELHRSLGIPDEDHFVRPLAKRGYSKEGLELDMTNLVPEVTATIDGIFWHPLSTDADMQISRSVFPLRDSVQRIQDQLETIASTGNAALTTFT